MGIGFGKQKSAPLLVEIFNLFVFPQMKQRGEFPAKNFTNLLPLGFEKMDRFKQCLQEGHDFFFVAPDKIRAGTDSRVVDHRPVGELKNVETLFPGYEIERNIDIGRIHFAPRHHIEGQIPLTSVSSKETNSIFEAFTPASPKASKSC